MGIDDGSASKETKPTMIVLETLHKAIDGLQTRI